MRLYQAYFLINLLRDIEYSVSIQLPEENEASHPSPPEKNQEAFKSSRASAPEIQPKLEDHHGSDHEKDLNQKTEAKPA